jgi:hypothetical protein
MWASTPEKETSMRSTSKLVFAAAAAAVALAASAADARQITRGNVNGAYASTGDVTPSVGRDFVYGANHAPYGSDEDAPRDFQLQGRQ